MVKDNPRASTIAFLTRNDTYNSKDTTIVQKSFVFRCSNYFAFKLLLRKLMNRLLLTVVPLKIKENK